ncbi:MAG: signal peptidase I [Oscillospiraceae bacterium]|nr:signal peptidase I [Oscillospiraceae bacterium]
MRRAETDKMISAHCKLNNQTSTEEQSESVNQSVSQNQQAAPSIWKELGGLGAKILVIVITFTIIFTFLYGFHRVTEPNMSPMVKTGDLTLFYRLNKNYTIGDMLLLDFQGERYVQRVVAKEGDTVDIEEGNLVVNGSIQQESEIYQETWSYENSISFPLIVGAGQVFVLGDAREGATDSRIFGAIDVEDTLGSVITIIRRRNF